MSHDNDPSYSELLAKKLALLAVIGSAPLDGQGAFDAFAAKMELMLVAKQMKSLEATLPF
jgi:hypothetical protein